MSRWETAFRAIYEGRGRDTVDTVDSVAVPDGAPPPGAARAIYEGRGRDTVDTVDTVAAQDGSASHTVNGVNSVSPPPAVYIEAQGEAVAPEPLWPDPGTPERTRLDDRNAAIVTGYRRAALKRPPSWSDSAALPSPGCWCSCCDGTRWWTEAHGPKGWRCWVCHPGDHLTAAERREVRTG